MAGDWPEIEDRRRKGRRRQRTRRLMRRERNNSAQTALGKRETDSGFVRRLNMTPAFILSLHLARSIGYND